MRETLTESGMDLGGGGVCGAWVGGGGIMGLMALYFWPNFESFNVKLLHSKVKGNQHAAKWSYGSKYLKLKKQ